MTEIIPALKDDLPYGVRRFMLMGFDQPTAEKLSRIADYFVNVGVTSYHEFELLASCLIDSPKDLLYLKDIGMIKR